MCFVLLVRVAYLEDNLHLHSFRCPARHLILSASSGSKTFEMADANAVPGRINTFDVLTFLELR